MLDGKLRVYPELKEVPDISKEPLDNTVLRIARRVRIPRSAVREDYFIERSEIKPCCYKVTPVTALDSRSPLISLFVPAAKDYRRQFEERLDERKYSRGLSASKKDARIIAQLVTGEGDAISLKKHSDKKRENTNSPVPKNQRANSSFWF
eukprot:TRINITY_DN3875_c0_g1_i5.p1 TRINITY_DN3875_c0_g1~~TRINITY_DN3875_c0_g1_i5.p1  ORF type:complete len:150 (-),score=13.39 TRINITY_DN3875_c0_g1_i5:97-546(-)